MRYGYAGLALLLTACSLAAPPQPTAAPILPTPNLQATVDASVKATLDAVKAAQPTLHPTDTATPKPTNTPQPTNTTVPTNTPIPPTATLAPATVTAAYRIVSASQTASARAGAATSTALTLNATRTAIAEVQFARQTEVAEAQEATRTAVAELVFARQTQTAEITQYKPIDWRELINYPEKYYGDKIYTTVRIFNVVQGGRGTVFQAYINGTYEAIYLEFSEQQSGIYNDSVITVYGTVASRECFKNAYGAEVCQPKLEDVFIRK